MERSSEIRGLKEYGQHRNLLNAPQNSEMTRSPPQCSEATTTPLITPITNSCTSTKSATPSAQDSVEKRLLVQLSLFPQTTGADSATSPMKLRSGRVGMPA